MKEFVNSQHFTSTTDIMNSMKELFSDVLQTVMEAELEEKLGYITKEHMSFLVFRWTDARIFWAFGSAKTRVQSFGCR